MMSVADRYGVQMTFFLDYAECDLYGNVIIDVGREIFRRGHDLQLHLHPTCLTEKFFSTYKIKRLDDAFSYLYNKEECKIFLEYIFGRHAEVTSNKAVAFRAGGFYLGPSMLECLSEFGICIDSSYMAGEPDRAFTALGLQKFFRWSNGIYEIPVSCVSIFDDYAYLYNFNLRPFIRGSIQEGVLNNRKYLETFFTAFGDDAIAVMILHSRSFFSLDSRGHHTIAHPEWVERFDAFLADCSKKYDILSMGQFENMLRTDSSDPTVAALKQSEMIDLTPRCPICGTPASQFLPYSDSKYPRKCPNPKCFSLERHRVFAQLAGRRVIPKEIFNNKRMLHVSPAKSETLFFNNSFSLKKIVSVDICLNISHMPEILTNSFDVVFLSFVFDAVENFEEAIKEISRILTPNGCLVCYNDLQREQNTKINTDIWNITKFYGEEFYTKYRVGQFRIFGENDYVTFFSPYFECKLYPSIDMCTMTRHTWMVGKNKKISSDYDHSPQSNLGDRAMYCLPGEYRSDVKNMMPGLPLPVTDIFSDSDGDAPPPAHCSPQKVFPNRAQKFFISLYAPFVKIADAMYYEKLRADPSDFFAASKHPANILFRNLLSLLGPKPIKTDFSMKKFISELNI